MNRQQPATLLRALTLVAGVSLVSLKAIAAEGDGTTGTGQYRYLSGTIVWTQDHVYDDWGSGTSLSVGTGEGAGHLSIQNGARVELPCALFIGGKGYDSPYRIEDGHDGLVTVGSGSTLECGSQISSAGGAQIYVGWGSGVKGTMIVDGGELISNYILRVGCHVDSNGLMEVVNGGRVTLGLSDKITNSNYSFLSIATAAGSHGLLRIDGGSVLEFIPDTGEFTRANVGAGGNGTLLIEGGSRVSLGQDYAFVGVESGSTGFVHVRGDGRLELPRVTYMAAEAGSRGDMLVEGGGSQLVGLDLAVGELGDASLRLQDGARAELRMMDIGAGGGNGRVDIFSGAQLATSGSVLVGDKGSVHMTDGGQWASSSTVFVVNGGRVSLEDTGRWEAQEAVEFRSGSTLSFAVDSLEHVPELVVAPGALLTMQEGSRLQLSLSSGLSEVVAQGGVELPLISGELLNEGYVYELRDESGLLDTSSLNLLSDGKWGVSLTLDREAVRDTLFHDAARLVNALWSSTGVVQDYASALLDRPHRHCGQHVWGMGLGSFSRMSSQGGRSGFDFNGGGYALGADTCLQGRGTVGLSFGQLYGTNKASDGLSRIRQNSLMGSLYAHYDSHEGEPGRRMTLDAYATYGRVRNRARSSMYSSGAERSAGRWSDDVFALGLRVSGERPLTETASLLPFIGLRYVHGSHGSFGMASENLTRGYSSSSMHNLSLPVGFTLRGRYPLKRGQELLPELTLAYVWDMVRRNPHLSTDMLGEYVRSGGVAPGRHALMLRTGASWNINEHWATGLYYHLECRSHEVNQSVDMSVSYGF